MGASVRSPSSELCGLALFVAALIEGGLANRLGACASEQRRHCIADLSVSGVRWTAIVAAKQLAGPWVGGEDKPIRKGMQTGKFAH
jgi:hypothetical protein